MKINRRVIVYGIYIALGAVLLTLSRAGGIE